MTLEEKLFAELVAVCSRVFPDFASTGTERPYVTFQQIGGQSIACLDNTLPSKENADMQINVWADSRKQAKTLILAIEARLTGATTIQASPQGAAVSDFDADMARYCSRQDFNIWADR
ncbi:MULTISPECIES: DUF3168 domain-containing protein [unclassified Massilia]|uniref:DUF3168 domain-containing protein n=1 Tax=unclassified Massilia TaxID=2609279 RepID=UPI00177B2F0A|nr:MULTISPECIES: DUF3168 domain-containing protein [unclassified Massilia]MBD8531574.1 DUF3168 domain-containing protein [Massilia sp. CFBP 13647]MBD8673630.1 DUF3168 domain-containing protein [Massilia sp. CFBP 13721]